MKIRSFGCSFLAGDELDDPTGTWPALIARALEIPHENHAQPASGNVRILHQIMCYAKTGDFCFINWSFIDRFDYRSWKSEGGGGGLVGYQTLLPVDTSETAGYYFRHLYGQYNDMMRGLMCVKTAIDFLESQKIKFIMTYMDHNLFCPVDVNWEVPIPTQWLQDNVRRYCRTWHGKNFLEWSRINRFEISDLNHPLDNAHLNAAKFWGPMTEWILDGRDPVNVPEPGQDISFLKKFKLVTYK